MNERQTAEWLMERDDFLILTHVRPDGDTIGCAAGLCLALRGRGKTAWVLENPEATSLFTPYLEGCLAPGEFAPRFVVSVDIAGRSLFPENAKVWLERGIEAVGRGIAYTDVITLTPDAASGLDAVQAEFTMTPAYDITVTLSLADNSQGNCLMTLTLSGQRKQQVTTVTGGNTETGQTTVTTTTISWDTPLIEKGVTG